MGNGAPCTEVKCVTEMRGCEIKMYIFILTTAIVHNVRYNQYSEKSKVNVLYLIDAIKVESWRRQFAAEVRRRKRVAQPVTIGVDVNENRIYRLIRLHLLQPRKVEFLVSLPLVRLSRRCLKIIQE
jgi:hypothetical protein